MTKDENIYRGRATFTVRVQFQQFSPGLIRVPELDYITRLANLLVAITELVALTYPRKTESIVTNKILKSGNVCFVFFAVFRRNMYSHGHHLVILLGGERQT